MTHLPSYIFSIIPIGRSIGITNPRSKADDFPTNHVVYSKNKNKNNCA